MPLCLLAGGSPLPTSLFSEAPWGPCQNLPKHAPSSQLPGRDAVVRRPQPSVCSLPKPPAQALPGGPPQPKLTARPMRTVSSQPLLQSW